MSAPRFRPPETYVHGLEGPSVVVPARVAAWLERYAGLRDLRTAHRGADAEVDAVLVALALAAQMWRQRTGVSSDQGTDQRNQPDQGPCCDLSTTEAADRLNMTDRGVRAAIARGSLTAHRDGDRWRVAPEDLEHYRAGRAA
ncbi:helix-turn-helix domain-containing protein [Micromonospora sp. C41]|uniref:helix-turn-helix domain-containing protein n=1 Tax=Micromonospora sp. C41 TaxID=2824878 RepID=UPI001B38C028|nr:helix-turn-helix domain-containing protein [Micromonospora sp. C41]MBQ1060050.1 helix-turn-helix domain-containing protein [Micromonospora sp. C41]